MAVGRRALGNEKWKMKDKMETRDKTFAFAYFIVGIDYLWSFYVLSC